MSKRTRKTAISENVRQKVKLRDQWCIFCGRSATDLAHFIPRSSGGLGIEQNLAYVCRSCHMLLDQSTKRREMMIFFENYLTSYYGKFDRKDLIFKKYES